MLLFCVLIYNISCLAMMQSGLAELSDFVNCVSLMLIRPKIPNSYANETKIQKAHAQIVVQ